LGNNRSSTNATFDVSSARKQANRWTVSYSSLRVGSRVGLGSFRIFVIPWRFSGPNRLQVLGEIKRAFTPRLVEEIAPWIRRLVAHVPGGTIAVAESEIHQLSGRLPEGSEFAAAVRVIKPHALVMLKLLALDDCYRNIRAVPSPYTCRKTFRCYFHPPAPKRYAQATKRQAHAICVCRFEIVTAPQRRIKPYCS